MFLLIPLTPETVNSENFKVNWARTESYRMTAIPYIHKGEVGVGGVVANVKGVQEIMQNFKIL